MAVVALRCGCGETHRLHLSDVLASGFRKPPARSTDCRLPAGKDVRLVDPAVARLQPVPVDGELAQAFG